MKGRAVLAAYADTGADAIACPHCDAEPGEPCRKPDGRVSRVPCVARLAAADLAPAAAAAAAAGLFNRLGEKGVHTLDPPGGAIEFSEPRHPREDS